MKAPICGATATDPEPFNPTLTPWTGAPTCYWCHLSVLNGGKCCPMAVVLGVRDDE